MALKKQASIGHFDNLLAMFLDRADQRGDEPFLSVKSGGNWQAMSWRETREKVARLAKTLRDWGLAEGDRVLLLSENRPEWCIADLAIMAAGGVTVPAYTTNTTKDHVHLLSDSGARMAIVSTQKLAEPLLKAVFDGCEIDHFLGMEPMRIKQQGEFSVHSWADLGEASEHDLMALDAKASSLSRKDLACLIYTSGTGGVPRGVMQSHGAILHNCEGASSILIEDFGWGEEVFLSFLPLSHAYEHTGGQYLPIAMGGQIFYAEGLDKLAANIEEVGPTVMVVVPRLFEVLRTRMLKVFQKQGGMSMKMLDMALSIGERSYEGQGRVTDLPGKALVAGLLKPKIRKRFGGRLKALVSGGAPLNPDIGLFFNSLGLTLLQGYGQTEAGPVISCNRPSAGLRMDTVGPPLANTEVRIADDGEICVRGELVMNGYWNNERETARVIQDGWLLTGDIGHIDEAGRVVITDRKKDIIVNDKGDNVAPQRIEGRLTLQPEIGQAMVYGDRKPYVVALVVPDPEWTLAWCQTHGVDCVPEKLAELPDYRSAVREAVNRVNDDLSVVEKVRQFAFADEAFTIENNELTPSLKIRRHIIRERYADRLNAFYKG